MTDIDTANSAILDALNKVVDRYRRSGAPIVVYTEDNMTVARIASIEFSVTVMVVKGWPASLRFSCKPNNGDIEFEISVEDLSPGDIEELAIQRFRDHMDRLAEKGVHPACDLQRR